MNKRLDSAIYLIEQQQRLQDAALGLLQERWQDGDLDVTKHDYIKERGRIEERISSPSTCLVTARVSRQAITGSMVDSKFWMDHQDTSDSLRSWQVLYHWKDWQGDWLPVTAVPQTYISVFDLELCIPFRNGAQWLGGLMQLLHDWSYIHLLLSRFKVTHGARKTLLRLYHETIPGSGGSEGGPC